jgi:outer membrane protein OmpA-like peptidoglycan-associated protein/ribosomal protein L24E
MRNKNILTILLLLSFSFFVQNSYAQKNKNKTQETVLGEEESAEVDSSKLEKNISEEKDEVCQINDKKALELYDLALKDYKSGKSTDAKAKIEQALEREPNFAKAYILLGEMAYKSNPKSAAEHYEKSIEICSNTDAMLLYKLAKLYYADKSYVKSKEKFTAFLDANSNKPDLMKEADSLVIVCDFYDKILNHPVPFNPTPVAGVNTTADEYLPIISPDNEILLFTRKYMKQADKFSAFSGGKMVEEFTISKKIDGNFDKGKALPAPFNSGLNEGGASLTIDNKQMYLTICNVKGGMGSCDLWTTQYKNDKWQMMQNLGSSVNDSTWQSQASVSSDGKIIYFSSDREGGFGGKDIYKIVKDEKGYFGEPINLGEKINTAKDEKSPFIHTDNKTLYFCSNGQLTIGGFDIYYARLDSSNNWQKPENIGSPINSPNDDLGFFVSTDGKQGYFASNKMAGSGGWDIYSFDLYETARPQKVLFMKGKVQDEKGQVIQDAKMQLKDLQTNESIDIAVDSNGEYVFARAMDHDQMVLVNKDGYFYNSQTIKANDTKFEGVSKKNFDIEEIQTGKSYKIKNLVFANNSSELNSDAQFELMNLVNFLNTSTDIRIEIAGHTDNVGNDQTNLELSQNRAKAVYQFLIEKEIDASRLRYKGYGETKPKADNNTEAGRAINRRTEITIL